MSNPKPADNKKLPKAAFPGGTVAPEKGELRVAIDKAPYAEIIGHAVLEPEVEVCGVLVGRLCEDASGEFLHIAAAIRGEAAKQQGAQVTFTHETWNHIHREMDSKHPNQQIVGWYHTHGGFGIFLSEMDTFIQKNFFSAPYQVAYVFDPLAGSEGFFQWRDDKPVLCRRHWVGGRERKGSRPPGEAEATAAPAPAAAARTPGDLTSVTAALQKTASALQAMAATKQEEVSLPPLLWAVGGAAAALMLLYLTGYSPSGGHAAEVEMRPGVLLVLQTDPATGSAVGMELRTVQQRDTNLFKDPSGRLYVGLQARAPDGRVLSPYELLSQAAAAAAITDIPQRPTAPVETPLWRLYWPYALAAAGLLAAIAAALLYTRKQTPGS